MTDTEQIVLQIIMEVLHLKSAVKTLNINWQALYGELDKQALLPLTYPWVQKKHGIPPEVMYKWKRKYASQSFRWVKQMNAQNDLINLLTDNNYTLAILKGTVNGINYPIPQLRGSGDIDFLVKWEEVEEIFQLLLKHGYQLVGEKNDRMHHIVLIKNTVIFELHKSPGGSRLNGKRANYEMVNFFQNGLEHIENIKYENYVIPILPRKQNAMVLLLHTAEHLKTGIGIRHVLDWMMFVKENIDDEFWFSELEVFAIQGNVDTLAKVMTKMCQMYLGLSKEITWCQDADVQVCQQLLDYLFQQGDFGIKAGTKDAEIKVLATSQSIDAFFRRVSVSSLYSMPLARKYTLLKPVAWVYQLLRYLIKACCKGHIIKNYSKDSKIAKERAGLFDRLGIKLD